MTRPTTGGSGNTADRRRRRAWIMEHYASDFPGLVRCYRCGILLYNPDDHPDAQALPMPIFSSDGMPLLRTEIAFPLTIDRIIPGCEGGTYRRNNIRPACRGCNIDTGWALGNQRKAAKKARSL